MAQKSIFQYVEVEQVVQSLSKPNTKHVVIIKNGEPFCTCPGFRFRHKCRHTAAYFNTTNESGQDLEQYIKQAQGQELAILQFFLQHSNDTFTPAEVQAGIQDIGLLTSVRRAMTNLTCKGYLEKTTEKRKGRFNRNNFTWRLKEVRK